MRRVTTFFVVGFLSLLFSVSNLLLAQPITGTKTIGATNSDFLTIHAAICSLNVHGTATGGVTFLIHGGTYTESTDTLFSSMNSGPNARIVFRPADTLGIVLNRMTYRYSGTTSAFVFRGADYITFDGSNPLLPGRNLITLTSSDSSCLTGFWLINGNNICIKNIDIILASWDQDFSVGVQAGSGLFMTTTNVTANNDSVLNCQINVNYIGISISRADTASQCNDWVIMNNRIVDFSSSGVYLNGAYNPIVRKNTIFQTSSFRTDLQTNLQGINIYNTNGGIVDANWIYGLSSASYTVRGIYLTNSANLNPILISNNMIDVNGLISNQVIGIDAQSNFHLCYNTVHVGGVSGSGYNSYALVVNSSTPQTADNNIFSNDRTGGTNPHNVCVSFDTVVIGNLWDYNLISNGTSTLHNGSYAAEIFNYNTYTFTYFNTLADLRAASGYRGDVHSNAVPPTFVGSPDLHIDPTSPSSVESHGTPDSLVTTDFDGDTRNTTTPDIGCDEGNFSTGDYYRPTISSTPLANTTQTTPRIVTANLRDNVGIASGENAPRVYYKRLHDTQWSWNTSDSLQNDSIYFFTIPSFALNNLIQYYIVGQDTSRNICSFPDGARGTNPPGTMPPPMPLQYYVSLPVNGTKTIGGNNPDYLTIHEAINALNTLGTTTGTTFLLRGGTYNEPLDSILPSSGVGVNARLVFKPADTNGVVINKEATFHGNYYENYAFFLNKTDYISFDGSRPEAPGRKFITIVSSDGSCNGGFSLKGCSYNSFKYLNMTLIQGGSAACAYAYSDYVDSTAQYTFSSNDTIQYCNFTGSAIAINVQGSGSSVTMTGWVIANNQLVNFSSDGVSVTNVDNCSISHNTLHNSSTYNYNYGTGIDLNNVTSTYVDANWIYGAIAKGITVGAGNQSGAEITNNMISLAGDNGDVIYGITLSGNVGGNIINNSVYVGGTFTGTFYPTDWMGNPLSCLSTDFAYTTSSGYVIVANNIFINNRTGGGYNTFHLCMNLAGDPRTESHIFSNYNIISANDGNPFDNTYVADRYDSTAATYVLYNTLADIRAAAGYMLDSSSIGVAPVFVGVPDLHISPLYPTPVEGNAVWNPYAMRDFDGTLRTQPTTDIGCDEGNFRAGDYQRPVIRYTPLASTPQTASRPLLVTIHDNVGVASGNASPRLYYKRSVDSLWLWRLADLNASDSLYYFTIPGYPLNTHVQYYLSAQDTTRNIVSVPYGASGVNPPGTTPTNYPASYYVSAPLTGVKTIGGTNPDYETMQQAMTALNTLGVRTGGMNFRIRAGTYTDTTLVITARLDGAHKVTFGIDSGATVVLNLSQAPYSESSGIIFQSSFVSFDGSWHGDQNGRHLTISTPEHTTSAVLFSNNASRNTMKDCIIQNLSVGSYYGPDENFYAVEFGEQNHYSLTPVVGNSLVNCELIGGYDGIANVNSAQNMDSTIITKCDIRNFSAYGVELYNGNGILFSHNHIYTTNQSSTGATGINLYYGGNGIKGSVFDANWIGPFRHPGSGETGIITSARTTIFSNNFIDLGAYSNGYIDGFHADTYDSTLSKYLFNTIYVHGVGQQSSSFAFLLTTEGEYTSQDVIVGNIFLNTRTCPDGISYFQTAFDLDEVSSVAYSDYNLLSVGSDATGDTRYVAQSRGTSGVTTYNTLADFQASSWSPRDLHSISVPVPFVSDSNLHLRNDVTTLIANGAPYQPQVPFDFDGEPRNNPWCDIGADEFTSLGVTSREAILPKEYALYQNYPNPFNPSTVIRFSLKNSGFTKLTIYNTLGQLVTRLVSDKLTAGEYSIRFDATRLAGGVYFYRLESGPYTMTKKMVVIK